MLNTGGGKASDDGEAADETEAARDEASHGQHRVKLVEPSSCGTTARRGDRGGEAKRGHWPVRLRHRRRER